MSSEINTNKESEKAYHEELFNNREQMIFHSKYSVEKKMNALIMAGDVEQLKEIFSNFTSKEMGKMSNNPFRQQMYAVVIGIAVATRAAMEAGMYEEDAYTLSDIYIQKADSCTSAEELWQIYVRMLIDFAERVRQSKQKTEDKVSLSIKNAIDYILKNLHYGSVLSDVADAVGLSETYLSALFKKETGDTISEFIQKSKVTEAKSLLQYSEYSLLEITQYLGFCSQSHFSKTFRKYANMTPGQYRKMHFKNLW